MDNIVLYAAIVLTLLAFLLLCLLFAVKFMTLLWAADKKKAESWMYPLLEKYLDTGDKHALRRLSRLRWPLRWFLMYVVIYRSFGETGGKLARISGAYEELGFADYDLRRLKSSFWWVRAEGARALGQMKTGRAKPALLAALSDRAVEVRLISAWSLGRLGDADVIIPCMEALVSVSRLAGMRLSSTVFELQGKAVAPLVQVLGHPDFAVRLLAVHLLAEIGDHSVTKNIIEKTSVSENREVRIAAYKALGTIGDKSALDILLKGLGDGMWEVRAQSARGLGMIKAEQGVKHLTEALGDSNWWVRRNAGEALSKAGRKGIEALKSAYRQSAKPEIKSMAAQWLDAAGQLD